jgi:DHA1 family bicyclomycin/chloramphenicol resistance-like MFS transporter
MDKKRSINTILAFCLLPMTGFATDIYLPSLPSMASEMHVSVAAIQLSIVAFMVSAGVCQLFVGSLLDSFGRRMPVLGALLLFAVASFVIGGTHSIYMVYAMRIVQGITVAFIAVGKRAYFMDTYSGEELKNYTSLFSIVWATAPIVAPFLGGYLQSAFGWASNFYFLGGVVVVLGVLDWWFGRESLGTFYPFRLKSIVQVYSSMVQTADFTLGLVIIALCYAMVVVFNMASPFIVEHVFHASPVVTGYMALLSGGAIMLGGILSKSMIRRPMVPKIPVAIFLQILLGAAMIGAAKWSSLYLMMGFVVAVHTLSGFIFNAVFAYCLGRFSGHAGVASGLTGGGMFVLSSMFSYGLVGTIPVKNQALLGLAYLFFAALMLGAFWVFRRTSAAAAPAVANGAATATGKKEEVDVLMDAI